MRSFLGDKERKPGTSDQQESARPPSSRDYRSWLSWGPVCVLRQSGLCGMKAVASHPEGQLTMKEPKPRMYLWDYRRDLELSGKRGGKFLYV